MSKWSFIGFGLFIMFVAGVFISAISMAVIEGVGYARKSDETELKAETFNPAAPDNTTIRKKSSYKNYLEYDGIRINIKEYKFIDSYKNSKTNNPLEDSILLLLYIEVKNIGKQSKQLPDYNNFYISHNGTLINTKSDYIPDTSNLYYTKYVLPGFSQEGWIVFEVPAALASKDILFTVEHRLHEYYCLKIPKIKQTNAPS